MAPWFYKFFKIEIFLIVPFSRSLTYKLSWLDRKRCTWGLEGVFRNNLQIILYMHTGYMLDTSLVLLWYIYVISRCMMLSLSTFKILHFLFYSLLQTCQLQKKIQQLSNTMMICHSLHQINIIIGLVYTPSIRWCCSLHLNYN